jgi:hypothetical protein
VLAPAHTFRPAPAVRQILRSARVQPKLTIGAVNDPAEREAERVADEVMRMAEPRTGTGLSAISAHSGTAPVRRLCAECEQELNRKAADETIPREEDEDELIQTKEAPGAGPALTASSESTISGLRGGGAPLPASDLAFFEPRFGRSFENVRIHDGPSADAAAKSVNARAFTLGNNIAFAKGEYGLGSSEGRRLMAHELTHIAQHEHGSGLRPVLRRFVDEDEIGEVSGETVKGRYIYTCNCGWVDTSHVGAYAPNYAMIIAELNKKTKGTVKLQATVPGYTSYTTDIEPVNYEFDTTRMTQPQIDDIAIRIIYDMARREEYRQAQPLSGAGFWTAAAFEDISSDMVGGLVGQEQAKDLKLTQQQALVIVLKKCMPVSMELAKIVFKDNKKIMKSGRNWTAVPPKMASDPCATMKPLPYPDFNFTDTKKFPAEVPTSGDPPKPFK